LTFAFEVLASGGAPRSARRSLAKAQPLRTKAITSATTISAIPKAMLRVAARFRCDESIRFLPLG
jgi:hypothetical protein